jgi:hypothetical protein
MKKTLNYETVAGTLWGAVAIFPITVNGERLTAYVKQKAKSGCTVAPNMGS